MRICPKCNSYSADFSLAFCLADGTPLVRVDPSSQRWSEGVRVIKENEKAMSIQLRKSKLRRILMSLVTIVMVSLVVFVMTMNGYIYLKPSQEPEKFVAISEPNPIPAPASPTPKSKSGSQTPVCTDDDKSREKEMILRKFAKAWRESVLQDQVKIPGWPPQQGNRSNLDSGEPRIVIEVKSCSSASVTIKYTLQMDTPTGWASVPKVKRVACQKVKNTWNCGELILRP